MYKPGPLFAWKEIMWYQTYSGARCAEVITAAPYPTTTIMKSKSLKLDWKHFFIIQLGNHEADVVNIAVDSSNKN